MPPISAEDCRYLAAKLREWVDALKLDGTWSLDLVEREIGGAAMALDALAEADAAIALERARVASFTAACRVARKHLVNALHEIVCDEEHEGECPVDDLAIQMIDDALAPATASGAAPATERARVERLELDARRMRIAIRDTKERVQHELDRGYVLTQEPGAGMLWRRRWNEALGALESALAPATASEPGKETAG
jgi:hypothetical protein